MDITTLIGILVSFGFIVLAIVQGGAPDAYVDLNSVFIVVGGTIGATLLNYPLAQVLAILGVVRNAFLHKAENPAEVIKKLVQYSLKARKDGILSLENELESEDDEFIKLGLQMAIDGTEADALREILESNIDSMEARHSIGQSIFSAMGTYAPAFGMIGTLIGLIAMLKGLEDPSQIGVGMAVALITTLYGAILANAIFLPIAGKLKLRSQNEMATKSIIIEGIISIQSGDNPRIVESKLLTFLPPLLRGEASSME